jgi:solute carrier family 41
MCIIGSRRYRINPDNISTPLAATLGDIVTLGVMAVSAIALEKMSNNQRYSGFV